MRFVAVLLALAALPLAAPADAQHGRGGHRDQDAAYQARQQGQILPLHVILTRVRVPGAQYIGADLEGGVYRLTFMRGGDVVRVHVDARTGRPLGMSR
jgi:hypothetical protein